jgi:hypothetical protein
VPAPRHGPPHPPPEIPTLTGRLPGSRVPILLALAIVPGLLVPGLAPGATAQQDSASAVVDGVLIDDGSARPIAMGLVRLLDEGRRAVAAARSQPDGSFRLVSAGPGEYRVSAEALGYRTAEAGGLDLAGGDTVTVEFRLAVDAVVLDPLRVVARGVPAEERVGLVGMQSFFERYARYAGSPFAQFMTRDSLASWDNRVQTTGHMLQWTTRAVTAVDPATGEITLRGGCSPSYYLNGSRVPYDMIQGLTPSLLEAVEVYTRPAIPADLGQGTPCGVVSLWSRQSPPDSLPKSPVLRWVGAVTILGGLILLLLGPSL